MGEVRGEGLLAGLEFVSDKSTRARFDENLKVGYRVSTQCLQNGLIARAMPHGDILGFAPPLILTQAEPTGSLKLPRHQSMRRRKGSEKRESGRVEEAPYSNSHRETKKHP